jgi:pimeloyl-ACP methyl ester carboxylesterase
MHSKPVARIEYFRSKIDDQFMPCVVCETDAGLDPRPLVVEVSPGASPENLAGSIEWVESIAALALENHRSCVVLRPTGRGPGSVYQNYGEVDLLEAIEHVCEVYSIDRRRISITGASMGGAATWYLASHYPDVFAAAAPFCGYCDYQLWEKPGGLTFHMHEWEEPSWRSRSAALRVENLEHTPIWMVHGQWDRAVGGGVPFEHSRQMAERLAQRGFAHRFTEVPETGHGSRKPEIWEEVLCWLLDQVKVECPRHVALAAHSLRHNRSYWIRLEQLARYGRRGMIDATLGDDGDVVATTENVRALTLGPIDDGQAHPVTIDGAVAGTLPPGASMMFAQPHDEPWGAIGSLPAAQKRHACSGPISDLFHEPVVLVQGTTGSAEETFFNRWVCSNAQGFFRSRNGGVHRGGILGENSVHLTSAVDMELSDEMRLGRNLLLYGTPASNAVLKRYEGQVPLAFEGNAIRVAGRTYRGDRLAIFAIFPHPENPDRYLAVHGGVTPDAITWGSHLDMMLLPDYLVYDAGSLVDWGFWDNAWPA